LIFDILQGIYDRIPCNPKSIASIDHKMEGGMEKENNKNSEEKKQVYSFKFLEKLPFLV